MKSEWREIRLDSIVDFLNAKRIPLSSQVRSHKQGKYPYYGASGIVDYLDDYIFDGKYLLISEDGENLNTRKTPIAFIAEGKYWVNNHAHILDEKEVGILEYLKYYFSTLNISPYITGAVQPKLNKGSLSAIPITLPPKNTRVKINKVLSTLDDKIELNRKMNQTLEEMAQALFKSWFVDFDPVHAKAKCSSDEELESAACELGISKEILELFPSEFEESELGMIPRGWEVYKIEDILKRYKAPKRYKKDAVESYGKTVVLEQGADIILGYHNNDGEFEATVEEPMFIFGDHTCVMKLSTKPFSISENVIPLSGLNRNGYWTYYATYGQQTFQEYRRHWSELIVRKTILADKDICNLFAKQVEHMILKIEQNVEENNELIMTRDTLLPKLLSGELDVSELELDLD